jgi:hypothetical protein
MALKISSLLITDRYTSLSLSLSYYSNSLLVPTQTFSLSSYSKNQFSLSPLFVISHIYTIILRIIKSYIYYNQGNKITGHIFLSAFMRNRTNKFLLVFFYKKLLINFYNYITTLSVLSINNRQDSQQRVLSDLVSESLSDKVLTKVKNSPIKRSCLMAQCECSI